MLDAAWSGAAAVAVGEQGGVWISHAGTAPWRRVPPVVRAGLNAVHFQGALGWAVGNDGVILKTQDGGENWVIVRAADRRQPPLFDVWFKNPLHGFAVGAFGGLLRTADGGRTWRAQAVPSGDRHLYAAYGLNGRWLAAGESGALLASSDGGATWRALEPGTSSSLFGFAALPDGEVLVFGFRGVVSRSSGGGARWRREKPFTEESLAAGASGAGGVYLAGSRGGLWASPDGGRFMVSENDFSLSAVLPLPDGRLALAGEEGIRVIPAP